MPRLLRAGLQNRIGRGVVRARPAPQLRLASAKFGAGKFCRFKEQKRKFLRRK